MKKTCEKTFCGLWTEACYRAQQLAQDPRSPTPDTPLYRSLSLVSAVDDAETNGFLNALQTAERSQTSVKLSTSFLARFTHTHTHVHTHTAHVHTRITALLIWAHKRARCGESIKSKSNDRFVRTISYARRAVPSSISTISALRFNAQ